MDSDSENETAPGSSENMNFAKRMNSDFDTRKTYEDQMLKILNDYQRQILKNPTGAENFRTEFAKPAHLADKKKTLFIDLDDTLVKVSLYPLTQAPSCQLEIQDSNSGKTIKVRFPLV